jgi:hypothetical protein
MVKVAEDGGITAILSAMKIHKDKYFIQKNACGALWNLSVNGT